tara:strand:+ start:17916 stop:18884 length:969 start_codon:yes stop_codon:yes gene_type:complete
VIKAIPNFVPDINRITNLLVEAVYPAIGLTMFLLVWHVAAQNINTSLGEFPGPVHVANQVSALYQEHQDQRAKQASFYQRQDERNAKKLAKNPEAEMKFRVYTGKPSFLDQIYTSLITVATGFLIASLIAVPLGVLCGLNDSVYRSLNPIFQLFKPVSPLAWLPLVTMVVSALYISADPMFEKSFLTSAITVALCCLWPTVLNTIVGVTGVNRDLINVSRVIKLRTFTHLTRIILPASVPMVFAGLRLSLATGWMVLIAAEMLAQNPGLGKFVWDEFQNGSSDSLSRIMVAVLTIGAIGFCLDFLMLTLQRWASWDKTATIR